MLLTVTNLNAGYRRVPVIKDIDFTLAAGQILGLIGLNGAGKSTLLKTILGLLPPLQGQVAVGGVTINENHQAYASQIAYIPEVPILYEELTLKEHLEMTALGYGLAIETVMERAMPLLKMFRLDQHLDWFPIHFSKGMKQKVMITCALVTDAKLFIIDEPFLGLDPIAIRDFIQLLKDKASQGCGILLTTHMLSTTADFCDGYLLLSQGHLVGQGSLSDLQAQFELADADLDDIYIAMAQGQIGRGFEPKEALLKEANQAGDHHD